MTAGGEVSRSDGGEKSLSDEKDLMNGQIVVIGVGNEVRGDDALGLLVARQLRQHVAAQVEIFESAGEPYELIDRWRGAAVAVVVDAVRSHYHAGTVFRLDASSRPLPVKFCSSSSHGLGVAEAIELGRSLKLLPTHLVFFGIEGERFTLGQPLSAAVERALPKVVDAILEELAAYTAVRKATRPG